MPAKLPNAIRRRWKTICLYHQKEKLQKSPWLTFSGRLAWRQKHR